MDDETHLREALHLATASVAKGGGPFGAVVVLGGEVVGRGTNRVVLDRDPTAHAEILALRQAARRAGSHDLSGAVVYASSEPCPMCLGAILWARAARVVHAATRAEAAAAGFDDQAFYDELARDPGARAIPMVRALAGEAEGPFRAWLACAERVPY